jgi:hypothetical protein
MYMSSSSTYGLHGPRGAEGFLLFLRLGVALSYPDVEDGVDELCESSSEWPFKSLERLISQRMSDACFSQCCVRPYIVTGLATGQADRKADCV